MQTVSRRQGEKAHLAGQEQAAVGPVGKKGPNHTPDRVEGPEALDCTAWPQSNDLARCRSKKPLVTIVEPALFDVASDRRRDCKGEAWGAITGDHPGTF